MLHLHDLGLLVAGVLFLLILVLVWTMGRLSGEDERDREQEARR
jgi:hypothetical protein